jgi:hypothetical protein
MKDWQTEAEKIEEQAKMRRGRRGYRRSHRRYR